VKPLGRDAINRVATIHFSEEIKGIASPQFIFQRELEESRRHISFSMQGLGITCLQFIFHLKIRVFLEDLKFI